MIKKTHYLITGATGIIGKALVNNLIKKNESVTVVVRNIKEAKRLFGDHVDYVIGDVRTVDLSSIETKYIIHAASQTASSSFVEQPVETISVALEGTRNLLEFAKCQDQLLKFVFLSTMEIYGAPSTDEKISEYHGTNLNTMAVRSCYPESKRMCENLCASYGSEYSVPVNILRLTQTFGPGVRYNDKRIFAYFGRCAIEGKDIILKTKGETKRSYLYTEDAAKAIYTVAINGLSGEAYNVANEETYCSILEMANFVAEKIAGGRIKVRIEDSQEEQGFAPTLHMNLDCSKIKALGWRPTVGLEEMYRRMIEDMYRNN